VLSCELLTFVLEFRIQYYKLKKERKHDSN
jgi:hypothetical protein